MRGSVIVGFCYAQNTITPQWRHSLTQVLMRDAATKRRVVGEYPHEASGAHIATARCEIVRQFLSHPAKPDWLWIVDTDATFPDDILERLIASADQKDRPVVGALAFGVRPAKDDNGNDVSSECGSTPLELFPTVYGYGEHGSYIVFDYPRDALVRVAATGCHCLLLNRSMLADERWTEDGHPLPWFRSGVVLAGKEVSEDQFFCMKAGALGYPIHVDTAAKTGHVKTFVADEMWFRAQRGEL